MSKYGTVKALRPIKAMLEIIIRRNGEKVYHYKRKRDLHVWKGQSIYANLISQGAVGTSTAEWRVIASENNVSPDMGDDSGNPEANEFNPLIGTPVAVVYGFNPTIKPSGGYQSFADLQMEGTVISDGSKTLRKVGIIDMVAVPNRNIVFEDMVIPKDVVLNDEVLIRYIQQFG